MSQVAGLPPIAGHAKIATAAVLLSLLALFSRGVQECLFGTTSHRATY